MAIGPLRIHEIIPTYPDLDHYMMATINIRGFAGAFVTVFELSALSNYEFPFLGLGSI
jgi:hypothetical protein